MSAAPIPGEIVQEALRLRRWLLQGAALPEPEVSPAGWELFLRVERCAAWLRNRVTLGEAATEVLEQRAMVEWQRILSARASMARIGAWALAEGRSLAVLKGGVSVIRGQPTDLMDFDVLGRADDAAALVAFLDAHGFHPASAAGAVQLELRMGPGMLPVEVHTELAGLIGEPEAWRGWLTAPIAGLQMLQPEFHLWYVLHHCTLQHTERRGRIRDLLVISEAMAACSPAEIASVEARMNRHRHARTLRDQFQMAKALASGEATPDAYRLITATLYVLNEWVKRHSYPTLVNLWMCYGTLSLAAARSDRPSDLGGDTLAVPSGRPWLIFLRRVLPRAERLVRLIIRRLPNWTARPFAEFMIRRAERSAALAERA
jgi:hypothetical protein